MSTATFAAVAGAGAVVFFSVSVSTVAGAVVAGAVVAAGVEVLLFALLELLPQAASIREIAAMAIPALRRYVRWRVIGGS
jgi:hypothetical protein